MLFALWKGLRGKSKQTQGKELHTNFYYEMEKDGIRCYFYSEKELSDAKLQKAADIISANVAKGVPGNTTAHELHREFFDFQDGAVSFSKKAEDLYILEINNNPLEFR